MTILIIIFGISSIINCAENTSDEFLRYLIENNKYDNALFELNRLTFQSKKDKNSLMKYKIIEAYLYQMDSNHHQAIEVYSDLIYNRELSKSIIDTINYNLALSLFEIGKYKTSLKILNQLNLSIAKELLIRNLLIISEKDSYKGYDISEKEITDVINLQKKLKNPTLAMVYSVIVPGLGQMYANHFFDGLQSFIVNFIGFSFSYLSLTQERESPILPLITVTGAGMFYLANILSAKKTVYYFNQKTKENYILSTGLYGKPLLISF